MSDAARVFPVAVVIIGAGAGTRFGGPKALATLPDGRRFLDAVAETAGYAGLDPVISVLPPDVAAPVLGTRGAAPNVARVVVNANPKSEQIVSARLGLAQLSNTSVVGALLWPVDHPFVRLESVLAILDAARRTGAMIVVPRCNERRGHPVFFHRELWRELMTVADGGARGVMRGHQSLVHEVEVSDAGVLRDIDTQQELRDG